MHRTHKRSPDGFTLIELMIVILLMGMLAAVAMPNLLVSITITEHQNEARHLVSYGRAAMAHASMAHENIVVRIDLDNQEYWTEKRPDVYEEPEENGEDDPYNEDDEWIPDDPDELDQASQTILMGEDAEQEYKNEDDQNKILARQKENMEKSFASMIQNALFASARRVRHDREELFDDDLGFDRRREEEKRKGDDEAGTNAVDDPLLQQHRVIETVLIESIRLGEEIYIEGVVEIELSPLGLSTDVSFVIINEDEDVLVVHWDPLTGNAWYGEMKDPS